MHIVLTALITLTMGLVVASFCERTLHFHAMHKRFWPIGFVRHLHADVHHGIFGHDDSFHLQSQVHRTNVTMSWWACFVVVPLATVPFCIPMGLLLYFHLWGEGCAEIACGFFVAASYFGTYEYLHWCMHVPKQRFFEPWLVFRWLKEHHRLHHLNPRRNGNVVLPIADLLFCTLIVREA